MSLEGKRFIRKDKSNLMKCEKGHSHEYNRKSCAISYDIIIETHVRGLSHKNVDSRSTNSS